MSEERAAELEREIARTREDVDRILDTLGHKLSPRHLLNQAVQGATRGPRRVASNVGSQIVHHPIPAAIAGIGLAWLILAARRDSANGYIPWEDQLSEAERDDLRRYERLRVFEEEPRRLEGESDADYDKRRYHTRAAVLGVECAPGETPGTFRERIDAAYRTLGERVKSTLSRIGETAKHGARAVAGAAGTAKDRVMDAAGAVKHGAEGAAGAVKHRVMGAAGAVKHGAEDAAGAVKAQAGHMKHGAEKALRSARGVHESNPLVAGAVVFAVGAALGALAPNTQVENRLLAERKERLKQTVARRAGAVREEAASFAKETAQRATEKVREAARTGNGSQAAS
jgi:hypothetical protein